MVMMMILLYTAVRSADQPKHHAAEDVPGNTTVCLESQSRNGMVS